MRAAVQEMRTRLGRKYPLVIDGDKVWTERTIASINPTNPTEVVGHVAEAGIPEAERAVKVAREAFHKWSFTPFEERAELLERVASIMDRRRFELSALEVFEVGKPWAEADGDIREAIDFCLFYAQQMRLRGLPATDPARARRGKLPALLAARRRPRHCALEFSDGDPLRHGFGRARYRQHRHHEAGGAIGRLRRDADGNVRGSRRPRAF